jgi:hypothetical protein
MTQGNYRVGIESYPSPTIGTNRKSNLSSYLRKTFRSLSIADYRGAAESFDGHTDGPRLFRFGYDPECPSQVRQSIKSAQSVSAEKPVKQAFFGSCDGHAHRTEIPRC